SHALLGPATIGGATVHHRGHAVFTPLFNHALCPAISIPCGAGRAGLPVGMQVVAPRFSDLGLLAFSAQIERVLAAADL
ncbi:MAG: amidase, partial [Sphingomonadales bacterium]